MTPKGTYPKKFPLTQYPRFSDRLKVAMDVRDYSNQKLAANIYTTPTAITMYRSGKRMPSPEVLCLIAKELDVSTDFLLGLSELIYI